MRRLYPTAFFVIVFVSGELLCARSPKINERSESFNEKQLAIQLATEGENTDGQCADESFNYRRESFNENCLRDIRDETNERLRSLNEGISEEAGSPFVSMPAIPAVYLAGDGDNQPLEKVTDYEKTLHYVMMIFRAGFNSSFNYSLARWTWTPAMTPAP